MEPASFALSIYPILGCIKDLGILVSNIKSAPEQVSSLSKDLDALTAVLDLVCDIFENPEAEPGVLEMRQTFEQVLKNCKDTIEALYSALSGISNSRSGGRLLWESIKIQWKLSHISDLRSYLEAQKTTLILTINMAN